MGPSSTHAKRPQRMSGWNAFAAVAVVGALLAFSFLSFAGPLAWPAILILGGIIIWARPPARAWLGLIAGIGAFLLFIGVIHLGDTPCVIGPNGETILSSGSCGGLDSKPWLIVGGAVFAVGIGLFARTRRSMMKTESP